MVQEENGEVTVFSTTSVSLQMSAFVSLPSGDNESVHINSLDVNVGNSIRTVSWRGTLSNVELSQAFPLYNNDK